MKRISSKESEVANILNSKRDKAHVDIYKESDFSGIGILVDEELNVYKYEWKTVFNKETHNFNINNYLYESKNKMNYEELEHYLINDLSIVEKTYDNDSDEETRTAEIIRLNGYEGEFQNKELYDKIRERISNLLKEELWKY